jgi:ectoine hydroxylase-related dioxygenase (phytanoyl-CoA dioxygenase family)
MVSRHALNIAFAPKLHRMLEIIFGEPPVVHQGLHFEVGSTQAIHQDTAYVVVRPPLALTAAWIALEDVKPGSGELIYYRGSHRMGDFIYPGNRRNWDTEADGHPIHDHHLAWLHQEAMHRELPLEYFWPKRGTALIWHADLAHGGSPIVNSGYSRRSIVFHYCPASAKPAYLESKTGVTKPFKTRMGEFYSSYYSSFGGKVG